MRTIILAALLCITAACTKLEEPTTPASLGKRHPGYYQVLMQGPADWHKFQPLGAWSVVNQDLLSPGRSNALTLAIPFTWQATLGIELTVHQGDTMVATLTGPAGIVWSKSFAPGQHSNTSNPEFITLSQPANAFVVYFKGETGGYINTLNLIKFQ